MQTFIDLFLHLDTHLPRCWSSYGQMTLRPPVPDLRRDRPGGDAVPARRLLLFAAGALAATTDSRRSSRYCASSSYGALLIAAILGDAVNFAVGHYIGPRVHAADDGGSCKSS